MQKEWAGECVTTPGPWHFLIERKRKMNATTTTPTRQQRKPRLKPARSIRLCVKPTAETAGVVRIKVGKQEADYLLTELAADFGRGFKVEKIGFDADAAYAVNIDGEKRTCECSGFNRWNHCKHADGLAALIAAGRL